MGKASPEIRRPGESSRRTAHLLDTAIRIPGTRIRIGLDPLIGLIPGIGDAIASAMGTVILLEAARQRLPRKLLARMGGNMVLNASVGAVPVIGDIFSVWFRSNSRNYAILKAWLEGNPNPPPGPGAKWIAAGCLLSTLLIAALCVALVKIF
jgi:hypothetical protein